MPGAESAFEGCPPQSIGELLRFRGTHSPRRSAISFVNADGFAESLTYAQLLERSEQLAALLAQAGPVGQRALLLYPPGVEFLVGFCGCVLAGWTPVPTCFPKPGRNIPRLDSIAADCHPSLLLSTATTLAAAAPQRWHPAASAIPHVATDQLPSELPAGFARDPAGLSGDAGCPPPLTLLQYTSGSTSRPKGVKVTAANLMANLEMIRTGFHVDFFPAQGEETETTLFWLPAFHDMGLIGGLLTPLYLGAHTVVFAPGDFLSKPLRWLELVSQYRATVTGAPNFAYQLCVDRIDGADTAQLDLSCLKIAFCGAEPIQARTLEQFASRFAHTGFRAQSLLPCYGLAEATLYVSGGHLQGPESYLSVQRDELASGRISVAPTNAPAAGVTRLVSCGKQASGAEVVIVDPETSQALPADRIGEIWVGGPAVSEGYWQGSSSEPTNDGDESNQAENRFAGRLENDSSETTYCRTGDLGFLHDGQLFVTGRLKDLIILRGRNHYPQDIEQTVSNALGANSGTVAAFSVENPNGEGLAIVAEPPRTADTELLGELVREIRRAVIDLHEIDPRHIALVRPASIPITTSGKVQRSECRRRFESNAMTIRHRWDRHDVRVDGAPLPLPELPRHPSPEHRTEVSQSIECWLISWLAMRGGMRQTQLDPERPMDDFGLDSFSAMELSGEIEDWLGIRLTPEAAFLNPTPRLLAGYLADCLTTPTGQGA